MARGLVLRLSRREQGQRQIVVGGGVTGGGGLLQQLSGAGRVGLDLVGAGIAQQRDGERIDRVDVTAFGGPFIPFCRRDRILGDAQPLPVDLAEQRHRGGVGVVGLDPLQRLLQSAAIMPGLVGAIGEVLIGRARVGGPLCLRSGSRCGGEDDTGRQREAEPARHQLETLLASAALPRSAWAAMTALACSTSARMSRPSSKAQSPSATNSARVSTSAATDSASGA